MKKWDMNRLAEGVADNTEAQGELPDIPSSDGDSTDTGEAVSDSE